MPVGSACIILHLLGALWFFFRPSHFSKVLFQHCRVVKPYLVVPNTLWHVCWPHTKLFRKWPQIKK